MKVIPQYKVLVPITMTGLYIIYKKNYAMRQDIGQTNGKMHLV